MTIGTRFDLDQFSQVNGPAPMPDQIPTRFFNGVTGKLNSEIVAMTIDWNGNVFTYFDDGTFVMGTVSDLGAYQGPQAYGLPREKVPRDIVAVASQPEGGVLTYYRDGTVSRGLFSDLGMFGQPKPFETGNGRGPQEILGIDFFSNGTTLTLFEQPVL
jgi:hypothetical protein